MGYTKYLALSANGLLFRISIRLCNKKCFILFFSNLNFNCPTNQDSSAVDVDLAASVDKQIPISSTQANHLTQSQDASGSPVSIGHGY